MDLINLGFYTESFVNLFSLLDDLTQETIKAGLGRKGLNEAEQKAQLRSIKEDRLRLFLTTLAKLCDWKSLEEADPALFGKLMNANVLRNKIMHGSERLTRQDAIDSSNSILATIGWLRSNPFGYSIPPFPQLILAEADFGIVPLKPEPITNPETSVPPPPSSPSAITPLPPPA